MDINKILVVDDEQLVRWSMSTRLAEFGYEVETAENCRKARKAFKQFAPHMAIIDVRLPDGTGMDLLEEFRAEDDELMVIMITAYADVDGAVKALKLGAHDFIGKPFSLESVLHVVEQAFEHRRLKHEVDFFRRQFRQSQVSDKLVGNCPKMIEVFKMIKVCAESDAKTVLVLGESGTGKQLVARALHEHSARAEAPFIEVNCAAIPENLLENELFGHEKGAFTDASSRQKGIFELAAGGTVFLDEIGDMPLMMQAKILKVIESRRYRRLGGEKDVEANVRIVAATNQALREKVDDGSFRGDLYFRLNVMTVNLPSLRERKEDIPAIVDYFVERLNEEYGRAVSGASPEMMQCLMAYSWPGNVRELRNAVERAMMLERGRVLSADHLNQEIREEGELPDAPAAVAGANNGVAAEGLVPRTSGGVTGHGPADYIVLPPDGISLEEVEKQLIQLALQRSDGNQTKAAEYLRMSRYTLRYRMKKFGLLGAGGAEEDRAEA